MAGFRGTIRKPSGRTGSGRSGLKKGSIRGWAGRLGTGRGRAKGTVRAPSTKTS